jgi:dihydrofolate synthase/folylpolyglutamate synthase
MNDSLKYLNSLGLHTIKPGLERIRKLLKEMDAPQLKVPGIIVAGTNGKGSVSAALSSMLTAQGYKTGLYTSPHLVRITERIKINGVEIKLPELKKLIGRVRTAAGRCLSGPPSYFEIITACAFLYFAEKGADFSVLEVGMGGRWDATNVIKPMVSVITNISKDHSDYLGRTMGEIAREKAFVIKRKVPVITAAKGKALEIIRNRAEQCGTPALVYGRDFKSGGAGTQKFNYTGPEWEYHDLTSNLNGYYQMENLSLAIAALESMSRYNNLEIDEGNLRQGLKQIEWGGRFEIVRKSPPLVLDSAHNAGGAKALVKALKLAYPGSKFTFMIGMLGDKEHSAFLKIISEIAGRIVITGVPSERALDTSELAGTASKYTSSEVNIVEDYKSAYDVIRKSKSPSCITGSVFLIGAVKSII